MTHINLRVNVFLLDCIHARCAFKKCTIMLCSCQKVCVGSTTRAPECTGIRTTAAEWVFPRCVEAVGSIPLLRQCSQTTKPSTSQPVSQSVSEHLKNISLLFSSLNGDGEVVGRPAGIPLISKNSPILSITTTEKIAGDP